MPNKRRVVSISWQTWRQTNEMHIQRTSLSMAGWCWRHGPGRRRKNTNHPQRRHHAGARAARLRLRAHGSLTHAGAGVCAICVAEQISIIANRKPNEMIHICQTCNLPHPQSAFYPWNLSLCRACRIAEVKTYYLANRERVLARVKAQRATEEYRAMRRRQYARKQVSR